MCASQDQVVYEPIKYVYTKYVIVLDHLEQYICRYESIHRVYCSSFISTIFESILTVFAVSRTTQSLFALISSVLYQYFWILKGLKRLRRGELSHLKLRLKPFIKTYTSSI